MAPVDLMLLLLKSKHGLTKEATEDIAKLVNVVNENNFASTSMHKIKKDFLSDDNRTQVHHVCSQCGSYVGIVSCDYVCCTIIWQSVHSNCMCKTV